MSLFNNLPLKYGLTAFAFMLAYFLFLSLIPGQIQDIHVISTAEAPIAMSSITAGMAGPDVEKLFGKPDKVIWQYGNSTITFKIDKVAEWSDPDGILRLH